MNNSYESGDKQAQSDSEHNELLLIGADNQPYQKPVLVVYGDVRDVTLGPTLGGGESGNAATRCDRSNVPDNCV